METQSGNGPEVLKGGEDARSSLVPRPADAKEDLEENRQIEKFDIPLGSLKQMFENPPQQHVVSLRTEERENERVPMEKSQNACQSVCVCPVFLFIQRNSRVVFPDVSHKLIQERKKTAVSEYFNL